MARFAKQVRGNWQRSRYRRWPRWIKILCLPLAVAAAMGSMPAQDLPQDEPITDDLDPRTELLNVAAESVSEAAIAANPAAEVPLSSVVLDVAAESGSEAAIAANPAAEVPLSSAEAAFYAKGSLGSLDTLQFGQWPFEEPVDGYKDRVSTGLVSEHVGKEHQSHYPEAPDSDIDWFKELVDLISGIITATVGGGLVACRLKAAKKADETQNEAPPKPPVQNVNIYLLSPELERKARELSEKKLSPIGHLTLTDVKTVHTALARKGIAMTAEQIHKQTCIPLARVNYLLDILGGDRYQNDKWRLSPYRICLE